MAWRLLITASRASFSVNQKYSTRERTTAMKITNRFSNVTSALFIAGVVLLSGCAGGPLSTREKGAGIGALGGAAAGGLIGSAVHHPAAGAAIGGALGLGAGALIGDQLQGQEYQNYRQDQQIQRNQAEINRNRQDIERLRRQQSEY
jgi:phage tail tape-measure protein